MAVKLKDTFLGNLKYMAVIAVFLFVANAVLIFRNDPLSEGLSLFGCIPIILIYFVASMVSVLLRAVIKINVPAVVYTALLMTIVSLPIFPWFDALLALVGGMSFKASLTPAIVFTGLCMGKDLAQFVKTGPKLILISILVFIGTYLGSALIAQGTLTLTGVI